MYVASYFPTKNSSFAEIFFVFLYVGEHPGPSSSESHDYGIARTIQSFMRRADVCNRTSKPSFIGRSNSMIYTSNPVSFSGTSDYRWLVEKSLAKRFTYFVFPAWTVSDCP